MANRPLCLVRRSLNRSWPKVKLSLFTLGLAELIILWVSLLTRDSGSDRSSFCRVKGNSCRVQKIKRISFSICSERCLEGSDAIAVRCCATIRLNDEFKDKGEAQPAAWTVLLSDSSINLPEPVAKRKEDPKSEKKNLLSQLFCFSLFSQLHKASADRPLRSLLGVYWNWK